MMKKLMTLFITVFAFLAVYTSPAMASGGSDSPAFAFLLSGYCASMRYACYWFGACRNYYYYC